MRTLRTTIVRRPHDRVQRCGPGRSELRTVSVREADVALAPTHPGQLGLLETIVHLAPRRPCARRETAAPERAADPRPVLFSYWRRQPYGPAGRLRRMTLIDVRA